MPGVFVALLRGINVSGKNKIAMPALRELCAGLGWRAVQTYIQSGNVIFEADEPAPQLEAALEAAIARGLGLTVPVIVRPAGAWPAYVAGNPFPAAAEAAPNLLMLALSKAPPRPGAVEALAERAVGGEGLALAGDAIWVHYAAGVGRSKLSPALFDRLVGSPVTARNWRTVLALAQLAAPGAAPAGGPQQQREPDSEGGEP